MSPSRADRQGPTVAATLADSLIEAGWLAALIVTPLFFNIYTVTNFDPDKASLLRAIVLVMAAAWVVVRIEGSRGGADAEDPQPARGGAARRLLRAPLFVPVALLCLAQLLSTLFSVVPAQSLWGSFRRGQGLTTTAAFVVLFLLVASRLRSPAQWRRIEFAIVLTSVPVAVYALVQRFGGDPVPWGADLVLQEISTLGNPIFLGAYLIMVFFVTVAGLAGVLTRGSQEARHRRTVAVYCGILALQLVALLLTRSRGPFLGLLAGLFVVGVVGVVRLRRSARAESDGAGRWARRLQRTLAALVILVVAAVGFLVLLSRPDSPLAPLRQASPYIERLATTFNLQARTTRIRTMAWEGVTDLALPHEAMEYPDGTTDRWNRIRPLVGTGPESLYSALGQFLRRDPRLMKAHQFFDRAHSDLFDAWGQTGLLGLGAHLLLFGGVFYYALSWLGLVRGFRQCFLLVALVVSSAALGAAALWKLTGIPVLAGVGLPAGLLAGFLIYAALAGLKRPEEPTPWSYRDTLILAFLGAIAAHFTEVHVGIAVTAPRTLFWLLSGALIAVGTGRLRFGGPEPAPAATQAAEGAAPAGAEAARRPAESNRKKKAKGKKKKRQLPRVKQPPARASAADPLLWPYALIAGLVLATTAFALVANPQKARSAFEVLVDALSPIGLGGSAGSGLPWIFLGTFLVALVLARSQLAGSRTAPQHRAVGFDAGLFLVITAAITFAAVAFMLVRLAKAARIAAIPGSALRLAEFLSAHVSQVFAFLLVLLFGTAVALARQKLAARPLDPSPSTLYLLAASALLLCLFAVGPLTQSARASAFAKQGDAYRSRQEPETAVACYERAIALQPDDDELLIFYGAAQSDLAKKLSPPDSLDWFARAAETLRRAQVLNPLRYHHTLNLANLDWSWARDLPAGPERQEKLLESARHFAAAIRLNPLHAPAHRGAGKVQELLGDLDQARAHLERALELNPRFESALLDLGNLLGAQASSLAAAGQAEQAKQTQLEAIEYFEQVVERAPNIAAPYNVLSVFYARLNRVEEALEVTRKYVEMRPDVHNAHTNLALLYQRTGEYALALEHAREARSLAPEPEHGGLDALIRSLEQRVSATEDPQGR